MQEDVQISQLLVALTSRCWPENPQKISVAYHLWEEQTFWAKCEVNSGKVLHLKPQEYTANWMWILTELYLLT